MTSKPRALLFTTYLAVLGIVLWLFLAPSPSAVWRTLDPIGYSMWHLRQAHSFTVPYRNDVGGIEEPVPSWRDIIGRRSTRRRLAALARASNPVTRLYALAGLELRDSKAAANLQRALSHDTTRITVRLYCGGRQGVARVRDVSTLVGTVAFARLLRDGNGVCP